MPELAEVEFGRKVAHAAAVGRVITDVEVADDAIVIEPSRQELEGLLTGATVTGTDRHGKHLWLELDRRPWLMLHFGMTGHFRTLDDQPLDLEGGPKTPDRSWPPRFTKLRMTFDDGGQLAFTNARRLGKVRLRDDPAAEPPISKLGFDPYKSLPSKDAFRARVRRRKAPVIKALLLDQTFAAGVGNWIADEVLYQARISPHRRTGDLSDAEIDAIRLKIRHIVKTAVRVDARKSEFPKAWLFHKRWGKQAGFIKGKPIVFDEVGGRTTAWVPEVQG
jgi:formamidopyrimidine-DNA glycosylase